MRMLVALSAMLVGATASATPIARYEAAAGSLIDDGFALRDDGKAVAFLTTDGAARATLHFADIGGTDSKVEGAPTDVSALHWLAPGRVLVVRSHDGLSTAQVFTPSGASAPTIGPFGLLALSRIGGQPVIVTYTRVEKSGVEHVLAAYSIDKLRPIKKRIWREDAEGQLRQGSLIAKPLWWSDGFSALVASRTGEYDKAHDLRRPDRFTKIDAFTGKVLDEHEIEDVGGFTRTALVRRDAPNQPLIVHWSDDRKKLLLLDGISDRAINLPRELWKYDATTLASQLVDDEQIALSLTIDPVNPEAVKRQKADVDDIELYGIDRKTLSPTLWLRLPGEQRRSAWHLAGHRLLLLRKGKGFDRGGVALEVYDLPEAASATR